MFLEEELNKIYNEEGVTQDSTFKMIKAILSRHPDPDKDIRGYINSVRQSDYIWHSFCKGKPELNPNGLRNYMLRNLNDEEKARAIQLFKWY